MCFFLWEAEIGHAIWLSGEKSVGVGTGSLLQVPDIQSLINTLSTGSKEAAFALCVYMAGGKGKQ